MMTSGNLISQSRRETFWHTLQAFNASRMAIALVLLLYLSFNARDGFWVFGQFLYIETCVSYLALAVLALVTASYFRRRFLCQLMCGIAVDILMMSTFYVAAGGARSGLAILYLFPLAGGAILAPLGIALMFAAVVTLIILGTSGFEMLQLGAEPSFAQSGLYGVAFFAAVVLLNRLAARLIRQEQLAGEHIYKLRVQQAINRIVIADTGDGVLVVDRRGGVHDVNPAAERMLGWTRSATGAPARLAEVLFLMPLADAFAAWIEGTDTAAAAATATPAAAPVFVMIKPGELPYGDGPRRDPVAHLKLRFVAVERTGSPQDKTVIFLEDVTEIENRAQQLKLASMGRLTASIAHEVRNPLSAISYAITLLAEEQLDSTQQRLTRIVDENVARLNRMIEDILQLARRAQPRDELLALLPALSEIVGEFEETHALTPGAILLSVTDQAIYFDPMHLREVIVNLLSNARRYASGQSASIRVFLVSTAGGPLELHVEDDGPGVSSEVRSHLFEPFYTTSSKGTGLGLYVARELCLNNGAMLDYETRTESYRGAPRGEGNASGRFVITFADAPFA